MDTWTLLGHPVPTVITSVLHVPNGAAAVLGAVNWIELVRILHTIAINHPKMVITK